VTTVTLARPSTLRVGALVAGLAAAIALRVAIGGADARTSLPAGLAFGAALTALALGAGVRPRFRARHLVVGAAGGVALALPFALTHVGSLGVHRTGGFAGWGLAVALVASAEEMFFRGSLFDAVRARSGEAMAVAVGAVAFAAVHVPLYGWGSLPIDLAAGLWFGALRVVTGSWVAPAGAHVVADWLGFWLR
jgi:membrane protease YdiL (CAAX protease family)